ncbi:MAG: aminoacetone oxidase family FAD-binding enzyme [Bacteroidales bacterium]|nr:aminoacetone oxidase family FAD-binding enzyme [Bacteroidales bacterium]
MRVAVVGAGAAGCFCSIELKRRLPDATVDIFESGSKPLAKVAVTGGGRCNLTNSFEDVSSLKEVYPRGDKLIRRVFTTFDHKDTWEWFEREGVRLTLQEDHCVFPASQDAMQVVNLLIKLMRRLGVNIHVRHKVESVKSLTEEYDAVVVTVGGRPGKKDFDLFEGLDLELVPPVPSLFTFNLPGSPVRELAGTVVENVSVGLAGTGFKASGPLLVTHWGMSGPAILKLSSRAARHLAESGYEATLLVNWTGGADAESARNELKRIAEGNPLRQVSNSHPEFIPSRLWSYLVTKSKVREDSRWSEAGPRGLNRLAETLTNDTYHIKGRSRFKEEFVTCGGVALTNINYNTLECKSHPGLYFAGETLDIDAVTGGFNLQAAWSTGYRVAVSIAEK